MISVGIPVASLIVALSAGHSGTFAQERAAWTRPVVEPVQREQVEPVPVEAPATVIPEEPEPLATTGSKAILIFLRHQRAYLLVDGQVVKTYAISSGAPLTPTPTGEFKVYKKQELRISSQAVPYRMAKYMAFTSNEAFGLHALPYLGSDPEKSYYWREARTHIGIPVSHGCIRFLPEEATEIYNWAEVGTRVEVRA